MDRDRGCDDRALLDALVTSPTFLPIADARRPRIGRAVVGAMLLAVLFEAFAFGVKELQALGDHAPWMDDPYDVVTSFAIFFIPIVGTFSAVRLALCRRVEPLPLSRVTDLLHGCLVLLVVVLATAASDWVAVAVGADRGSWTSLTPAIVAGLGLVTVVALLAAGAVVTESRRLPRLDRDDPMAPDWLADATQVADRVSRHLGPLEPVASRIVRLVDRQVWTWVRRRPITAAIVAATGFATLFEVGSLREGYSLPLLVFVFVVAWCGMFVLLVASGSYLGLVRSSVGIRGVRRRLLDAAVVGSASVPIALAFRGSLWWLVGSSTERAGLADLDMLLLIVATSVAGAILVIETIGRVHDPRTRV
jgi:hypothetical protein